MEEVGPCGGGDDGCGPEGGPWQGGPPDPGGCRLYNSVLEMMPSKPPCRWTLLKLNG